MLALPLTLIPRYHRRRPTKLPIHVRFFKVASTAHNFSTGEGRAIELSLTRICDTATVAAIEAVPLS